MGAITLNKVAFIAMVASIAFCSSATRHTVGDATGWVIPDDPNFYTKWASVKIFTVGDSLVFNFINGTHDVTKVSKDDYKHCHISNPGSTIGSAPAVIGLKNAGDHYYICSFEAHCASNQKLAIHVVPANVEATSLRF